MKDMEVEQVLATIRIATCANHYWIVNNEDVMKRVWTYIVSRKVIWMECKEPGSSVKAAA